MGGEERVTKDETKMKTKSRRIYTVHASLSYTMQISIYRKLAVIQVLVDSGAEPNTSSCEIACVAASDSDSNAAVLAWHLAGRNSRRESINTPCPIQAVSIVIIKA